MKTIIGILLAIAILAGCATAPAETTAETEETDSEVTYDQLIEGMLFAAVREGEALAAQSAIDLGADVNLEIADGYMYLMDASFMGRTELVRVLLDGGAEVNAVSDGGVTALLAACQEGHDEIMRFLLEAGADVNVASVNDGATPLMFSIFHQLPDIPQLMMERGADANARNATGQTALMFASQYGQVETARLLLESGADINAETIEGATALMYAAQFDQADMARLLLDWGADVNMRLNSGESAITIAISLGHDDIAEILSAARADARERAKAERSERQRVPLPERRFLVETDALFPFVNTPFGLGWAGRVVFYSGTPSPWAFGAGGFTGTYSIPNAGLHLVHGLCVKAIRFTDGPRAYSFGAGEDGYIQVWTFRPSEVPCQACSEAPYCHYLCGQG